MQPDAGFGSPFCVRLLQPRDVDLVHLKHRLHHVFLSLLDRRTKTMCGPSRANFTFRPPIAPGHHTLMLKEFLQDKWLGHSGESARGNPAVPESIRGPVVDRVSHVP
jgi:hypothetical protein